MYNRYIPGADGRYEHRRVVTVPPEPSCEMPDEPPRCAPQGAERSICARQQSFFGLETGDLLVLLILLLVLTDGEEGDSLTTLITLAAFLFLR